MSKQPEYRHKGRVDVFEEVKKPKKKTDIFEVIGGIVIVMVILIIIF